MEGVFSSVMPANFFYKEGLRLHVLKWAELPSLPSIIISIPISMLYSHVY